MQCPQCGNYVADGAAFCTTCGARQQAPAAPAAPVNPYSNPNPYGQPQANPYGQPQANPYGQPAGNPYANPNPYGQPAGNPYANPNPYGNPYGGGYRGPKPSVGFGEAISLFFSNYANFSGRARRSEYWYAYLFNLLLSMFVAWIPVIGWIAAIAILVPGLSVTVRRLHDVGKSGWWLLLALVPFGGIVLLIWECSDGEPNPNQYGPSPKYS